MQPPGSKGGKCSPSITVCTLSSHFNLFFLNCSDPVSQIRVWKPYHPWASLCHDAEQLFRLSCLSNSFCSWETDKRPNPGRRSDVSRKGVCVKEIPGISFLFILFSWLWQDRKRDDPHVGLSMSGRIKSGSRVPFALSLCYEHSNFLSEFLPFHRARIGENGVFVLCTKFKGVPENPSSK